MASKAKVTVAIDADSRGLKKGLKDAENDVESFGQRASQKLDAINSGIGKLSAIAGGLGIISLVSAAMDAVTKIKELVSWMQHLGDVSEEAAASAKAWGDAMTDSGLDPAVYAAVEDAAARANMPAEKLAETLKKIAETGGGIEAVAAALGTTADNLERAAAPGSNSAIRAAGLGYAGASASDAAARDKRISENEASKEGWRKMAVDALSASKNFAQAAEAWSAAIRATGSVDAAGEMLRRSLTWTDRNIRGIGRDPLTGRAIDAGLRLIPQQDAAQAAEREAAAKVVADKAAKDAAEAAEKAKAQADREAEARAREQARADAVATRHIDKASAITGSRKESIERITVQGPLGANALAASGGLLGGSLDNATRMAQQRQRSIDEINAKFAAASEELRKSAATANVSKDTLAKIAKILEEG